MLGVVGGPGDALLGSGIGEKLVRHQNLTEHDRVVTAASATL
jgi:hypothetical protein